MSCRPFNFLSCVLIVCGSKFDSSAAFGLGRWRPQASADIAAAAACSSRRNFCAAIIATSLAAPPANAGSFAPGGTLLDREVSVLYGNEEASPSRQPNNSNVIFNLDQYFKFGSAARWIPPQSTDFPETMPFVPVQQRYDARKKYGERIEKALEQLELIGRTSSASDVPGMDDPVYRLRPLGLAANSFLATENSGNTNQLLLARWYINETYLRIGDYRSALEKGDASEAKRSYECLTKAINSYLALINRQITSKVGDKFRYFGVGSETLQ
mmetsp:Transcript_7650/g.17883  ORF Transcript_7650/g.17883 Transcript_7650/m.17883 type:complete len:270 (-) Transcript_7650:355-1164(-)